jgi:hypothetical protein
MGYFMSRAVFPLALCKNQRVLASLISTLSQRTITLDTVSLIISDSSFHRFAYLPTELKLEILGKLLLAPCAISARSHACNYGRLLIGVSLANKEVYHLATELYYSENTFSIARSSLQLVENEDDEDDEEFRFPNFAHGKQVRKLELHIELHTELPNTEYLFYIPTHRYINRKPVQLLALARPLLPQREKTHRTFSGQDITRWSTTRNRHTSWQRHFTSLQELKIVVNTHLCLGSLARIVLEQLPDLARVHLRAKSVSVVATCRNDHCALMSTLNKYNNDFHCDGQCLATIERVVTRLVEGCARSDK